MTDDKQTVGMSASEGLAAFTAFAEYIKAKSTLLATAVLAPHEYTHEQQKADALPAPESEATDAQ